LYLGNCDTVLEKRRAISIVEKKASLDTKPDTVGKELTLVEKQN
jgi:hypothetical protein